MSSSSSSASSWDSNASLNTRINKVDGRVKRQEDRTGPLTESFKKLDKTQYRKRDPWTGAMEKDYERYKAKGKDHHSAKKAWDDYKTGSSVKTTGEQRVQRSDLAVTWGRKAAKAAKSRYDYMEKYPDAYKYAGIQDHIEAGSNAAKSGRMAVKEARFNYGKVYEDWMRQYTPPKK